MDKNYCLGILADTHLTQLSDAVDLADQLMAGPFAEVDAILHAGDMVIPEFADCFGDLPFYAVRGNMDSARQNIPVKRILDLAGYRVGLIHGWGPRNEVPFNVLNEFVMEQIDLLVFGHSHTPLNTYLNEILLFNPGSATDHRGNAPTCSAGLVQLGTSIRAEHCWI